MNVKSIFLPDSIKCYDLNDNNSPWSWHRTAQTENLIFFWEKGFGDDTSNPPQLDGHPMAFDLKNLENRVEYFYHYFRDTLKFTLPDSKANRYKMMVMINYNLDGTAYGGTYDDFIGALWVAPNRIQDSKLNCLAHELGHCFQLQIPADSVGDAWGGSGFYEMTSQWMLWRVNPNWLTDENYHFEAFKKLTHKAYLDISNIYHSPYVIEWWAEKRGLTSIAELYREGKKGDDPVITYKQKYGLTQAQFNDEMIECYQHIVDFDYKHARKETRPYACTFDTPMKEVGKGVITPEEEFIPEEYGFNAIRLKEAKAGGKVTADVKGENLRYALVAVPDNGAPVYGKPTSTGKVSLALPTNLKAAYLIVMGAPSEHQQLDYEGKNRQYPYTVKLKY